MRTIAFLSLALFIPLTTQACSTYPGVEEGHVVGKGDVVERPLTVPEFTGIEVEGAMEVELHQSATRSVVVTAQENIADLVTTEVHNGVWHIATREGYSTTKSFVIRIELPAIDQVSIEGSGDVKGFGTFTGDRMHLSTAGSGDINMSVEAGKVQVSVAGSGDVKLAGHADELAVDVAGSGDVNAQGLASAKAAVTVAGSGSASVMTTEELRATIAGSGDITYKGSPSRIMKNISGSGELRSVDGGSGPRNGRI